LSLLLIGLYLEESLKRAALRRGYRSEHTIVIDTVDLTCCTLYLKQILFLTQQF
jgi:hypothetical protein